MSLDFAAAVESVYRSDWGRIVATLIGLLGDFDLAEESAQEAFTAALDQCCIRLPRITTGLVIDYVGQIRW
jgi:predicted RNA polymerase sigma factor